MKRRWSDVFLEKPESSHVRRLFARIAGGRFKCRNNATFIIRTADTQDFAINRPRRNLVGAVHNAIEADADSAEQPVPRADLCTLRLATPLYDSFIAELENGFYNSPSISENYTLTGSDVHPAASESLMRICAWDRLT